MARKITVNMFMTLDGYGEFPDYPGSDFVPPEPDEFWKDMWSNRYGSVDTIIYGTNSYLGHSQFHALSKRKPTDPEYLFEFSRYLEKCNLVVLSHTLKKAEWGNTRIMKGELAEIVARLKSEPGNDIIVDAGPTLTNAFIKGGLADEYKILVFPVILGRGHHYWSPMEKQETLKLVSVKVLEYGELYLQYNRVP